MFVEPPAPGDAWADERLEYDFSMAAHGGDDELVLSAPEYPGGTLDWHSFDLGGEGHGLHSSQQAMPVPLRYAGMPASRWWEFEERTVSFGDIEAGPADIGRLLVAEFGTVYSDDWFLVPLRVPYGSLVRTFDVEVIDTFGGRHSVESTAQLDHNRLGEARDWRFFELTGDDGPAVGRSPWMLMFPTLRGSLQGEAVERVTFVRDEGANLGWGIEQSFELATGGSLRRRLEWGLSGGADERRAVPSAGEEESPWRWTLQTPVPPYWVPFVPERVSAGDPEVRLRRARMSSWETLDPSITGAKGKILAPDRPLRLYEEEIPVSGLEVTRAWQLARGVDGSCYLWMGRRKRPGRGERGSGLRFDTIKR